MTEYRGMPVVTAMAEEFKNRVAALKEKGIYPKLAVVRVGEREDDIAYEKGIMKRFGAVEAEAEVIKLPRSSTYRSRRETSFHATSFMNSRKTGGKNGLLWA